ncbi:MAG: OmpA family protein [Bacteroidota bacterium]|nr:OmpA family protein [Bacteroidota bacterium]
MTRSLIRLSFLFVVLLFFFGCSEQSMVRVAQGTYNAGEYAKAIDAYRKTYGKCKDYTRKNFLAQKLAECYSRLGQYDRAVIWYRYSLQRKNKDRKILLRFADALRSAGQYDEAGKIYQAWLDTVPDSRKAQNGLQGCMDAKTWIAKQSRYKIAPIRELNSKWGDYAPVLTGERSNEVIFTSSREIGKRNRKSRITGDGYADIYYSTFDIQKQKWLLPKLIDTEGMINTAEEEGAASISSHGDVLYFTRCQYQKNKNNGTSVFRSTRSGGQWSEAEKVDLAADDSIVSAHPSISADGGTLYFVSDRPGGCGGMDIWKAEKQGNGWSKPVNMGPEINTPGNETFPCIRENGDLYFSSDYHPGMGGYDIFRAHKDENNRWIVENMKAPLNSCGDDFGICFVGNEERGMFTSNRSGSRSDDLYSFVLPPKEFVLTGEVINKETDQRERNAFVRIIGTDGTMLKLRSGDGRFHLKLNPETEYICAAFKEGFLNSKANFSTKGLEDSKEFPVRLQITPTDLPIKIENVSYDFGKWEVPEGAKASLDSLVGVLEQNPNITIELMSHTDSRGDAQFNFDLSQKRAQSAVDYLVARGVAKDRLVAKGYGKTWPKTITGKIARQYNFLKKGDELNDAFINKILTEEQKEICHMLNRRTEFKVLSVGYHEK